MAKHQWKPPYDVLLRVAQALKHGNNSLAELQIVLGLPKHHVQLALQALVRAGCAAMFKKPVPGRGFVGWYKCLHYPARVYDPIKRKTKGEAIDTEVEAEARFKAPLVRVVDPLWQAWPMPVSPLPKLKGRVVRRLAI